MRSFNGAWTPTQDISKRSKCLGVQIELVTEHWRSHKSSTSKMQIPHEFYPRDISPPIWHQLPIWDNGKEYFEVCLIMGHAECYWLVFLWLHKCFIIPCSIKSTLEMWDFWNKNSVKCSQRWKSSIFIEWSFIWDLFYIGKNKGTSLWSLTRPNHKIYSFTGCKIPWTLETNFKLYWYERLHLQVWPKKKKNQKIKGTWKRMA